MFCSKCGTDIANDSQFCQKCGRSLTTVATSTGAGAAVAPAPILAAKPRSRKAIWILFPILLLVLWWAATSHSPGAQKFQQLAKDQHTVTLNQPDFAVKANGYGYSKFDVPPGASGVHFQGTFEASGGSGNDIAAYVLSADDFVNWQNRHAAKALYNSGKLTVGNFNLNMPSEAGTYYLVFDNRFSLLSQKSIRVNALLTYYQ